MALWLWWGSLWVWKVNCTQKMFQLARWVSSSTKDPSWSICFRFLKANSVSCSHLIPLTTHLGLATNIYLWGGGALMDVHQSPLPFTPPSPARNMPVLDVCLQMGETEAQVN